MLYQLHFISVVLQFCSGVTIHHMAYWTCENSLLQRTNQSFNGRSINLTSIAFNSKRAISDAPSTAHLSTLQWRHDGRWCIKSPASRLFTQPFIQAQIKQNIKATRHWPLCCGEFTGDQWIPCTKVSDAENVSLWWHPHVSCWCQDFLIQGSLLSGFFHET